MSSGYEGRPNHQVAACLGEIEHAVWLSQPGRLVVALGYMAVELGEQLTDLA